MVLDHRKDIPDSPRPPLAEGEVRFVGDPVALVVAENRYLAEDAADLVDVDLTRCRRSPTTPPPKVRPSWCGRASTATSAASWGRKAQFEAVTEAFASAAHVITETIHEQACWPSPWRPAA